MAESASTYVSVLQPSTEDKVERDEDAEQNRENNGGEDEEDDDSPTYADDTPFPMAFSLPRFIPLLKERIHVLNPFTRIFLVSWITLLDSIPDLELVTHLPAFLGGLFKFLSDPNQDVHVATQQALEGFLGEIKRISRVKLGIEESRKNRTVRDGNSRTMSESGSTVGTEDLLEKFAMDDSPATSTYRGGDDEGVDGNWIPGQDVQVDHQKILEILIPYLDAPEEEIQLTALRWVDNFFEICPEDLLPFVPRLLSHVLPAIAHPGEVIRHAALKVNTSLRGLIASLADEVQLPPPTLPRIPTKENLPEQASRRESNTRQSLPKDSDVGRRTPTTVEPRTEAEPEPPIGFNATDLDYSATVNALTLQFLNEHEQTRVMALEWLLMLHRKAPRKVLYWCPMQ